jgi:serpin B
MPHSRVAFCALVSTLATGGCHSASSSSVLPDPPSSALPSADAQTPELSAAEAPRPLARDPDDPRTPEQIADAGNSLGFTLYASGRHDQVNVALSPLSISMALAMTWAGARGETARQMSHVLGEGGTARGTLEGEARVVAAVRDSSSALTLRVANRLFGEKTYAFQQPYLDELSASSGASLEPLDFVGASDASRQHINAWVADATDHHITNLIPPSGVTADTRLVLADAIYFLGQWQTPFVKAGTRPMPFHLSATVAKSVPTMHEVEGLAFAHTDGVEVLEMPYTGGRLAMTFILPDRVDGLDEVERRLTSDTVRKWASALAQSRVHVALPRFVIDPGEPLALRGLLATAGMPLAFDPHRADFSAIGTSTRPEDRLFIGNVFHKAFVKVDEQGTEAAAATGASMMRSMAMRQEPPAVDFTADHPFLFLLRDRSSGTILFLGRMGDPSAAAGR